MRSSGFVNHDDPGLCLDRLLRTAALQRMPNKRKWPGYAVAFVCGALLAIVVLQSGVTP